MTSTPGLQLIAAHNSFQMELCWRYDSKERPSFREILKTLDDIAHSKFHQMPDDNFYTLQADWKVEIDEKIIEIREKEKVRHFCSHFGITVSGLWRPISIMDIILLILCHPDSLTSPIYEYPSRI